MRWRRQQFRAVVPWIAIIGILVAAWWLSKRFGGGTGESLWNRTIRRHIQTLGIVSVALLAAYLLYLRLSIAKSRRAGGGKVAPDPSLAGCFSFMAAVVTVLILILAVGLLFRIDPLIKIIAGTTIAIALYVLFGLVYEAIEKVIKRLAGRKTP